MKCIICGKPAEYMYIGNSYCKECKDKHMADIAKITSMLSGKKKTEAKEDKR